MRETSLIPGRFVRYLRRRAARTLHADDWSNLEIAILFGVTERSVRYWIAKGKKHRDLEELEADDRPLDEDEPIASRD